MVKKYEPSALKDIFEKVQSKWLSRLSIRALFVTGVFVFYFPIAEIHAKPSSKGTMIYESQMNSPTSVKGWIMEGLGVVEFRDGWMEMFSRQQQMHHVYWCPQNFPERFVAEWEAQNLNPAAGLSILFFAAKGENGEDIFDKSLRKRDGTFNQYTNGDILSYHISYYANSAKSPARPNTHLRKNNTFALVDRGPIGIPATSDRVHRMRLVKDGPKIDFFVDDHHIIDWTDDGVLYGRYLTDGKIGFRQMQWTRFRYRNFRVYENVSTKRK